MKTLYKRSAYFLSFVVVLSFLWFQWWHLSRSVIPLKKEVSSGIVNFSLAKELPIKITEAGGASNGNKTYVFGGIDAWGQTTKQCWAYDDQTDTWASIPDLPRPINHPGVVSAGDNIYVIGGFDPIGLRLRWAMFADWRPLATCFIYNTVTKKWSQGPDMPMPRGAGGIAANDTCIWYTGGIDAQKKISNSFFCFNIKTQQWQTLANMSVARDHLRMERVDNKLYAISGREDDLRKNLDATEVYNIETAAWSAVDGIPTPRGGFGSAVYGKYIYTFGGESFWDCLNVVERLNTLTGKWEQLPHLPEGRHGIIASVIDHKIHLVCGGRHPRISTSDIHRVMTVKE